MSTSTLLRLVLVVLCIAGLSAAQSFSSCPNASAADYFAPSNCTASVTCATTRCTCVSGTFSTTALTCSGVNTSLNTCGNSVLQACELAYMNCMQAAAATSSCLTSLKMALMNIVAGSAYNGSSVDTACRAETCRFYNASGKGNCTSTYYTPVCFLATSAPSATNATVNTSAPVVTSPGTTVGNYVGTMTLGGDYTVILANATATTIFSNAVSTDLTNKLNVTCNVTSIVSGSAIVTFTANVAANNAAFLAAVTAAASNGAWLVNAQAQFTALGGKGTFSLVGITAAGGTPIPTTKAPTGAAALAFAWSALLALLLTIFA